MTARNVCLIVLDSVRKDYFDRYAPRLRERATVSFDACRAASSWSVPSHASMFTGRLPHDHGVHAFQRDYATLAGETVVSAFDDHRTVGLSGNPFLSPLYGADALFDEFRWFHNGVEIPDAVATADGRIERLREAMAALAAEEQPLRAAGNWIREAFQRRIDRLPRLHDHGTATLVEAATEAVTDGSEPVFLFVNSMEAHAPFGPTHVYESSIADVPLGWSSAAVDWWEIARADDPARYESYLDRLRSVYTAAIDYLDRQIARLVDRLTAQTRRETIVVVTADHGEDLGYPSENRLLNHQSGSEGLLHVPLAVVNHPEPSAAPDGLVSHLDLPRLLCGLAAGESRLDDRETAAAERIGTGTKRLPPDEAWAKRGVRTLYADGVKYYWDSQGRTRRLRLTDDSTARELDEAAPPASRRREWFDVSLSTYRDRATAATTPDPAVRRRLDALGY